MLLAVTTELHAKWPSAKHPSCQRGEVKSDKSRNGMTETRLSGLVWARKEHDPLIRKHLPFLKLLSADAKQRVAPAPGS